MPRMVAALVLLLMLSSTLSGCLSDDSGIDISDEANDITNKVFTNTSPLCIEYTGEFFADVTDISENSKHRSEVRITSTDSSCTIESNGIPNHDFGVNGRFANAAAPVIEQFTFPLNPVVADNPTPLSLRYDNAIFLNGVKLDLLAAACYGVGPDPLGKEKIGCMDGNVWRYDPMHQSNDFGEDSNHAHTQPDGAYHYHGDPSAMYDKTGSTASGVIGFAADGFPIIGPYIDDNGTVREVTSGYILREGERTNLEGEEAFPGSTWNGQFRDDFVWQEGQGDLDQCNGMVIDGGYAYFVTFSFPWVMGCYTGTPDESFRK